MSRLSRVFVKVRIFYVFSARDWIVKTKWVQ